MGSRSGLLIGFMLAAGLARPALADQCALVAPRVGQQAGRMVKPGDTVQSFCQACGDQRATPMQVTSVAVTADSGNRRYVHLVLNGDGVDLAYVYVRPVPTGPWRNLGAMVKCIPGLDTPNQLDDAQLVDQSGPPGTKPGCDHVSIAPRRANPTYEEATRAIDCIAPSK